MEQDHLKSKTRINHANIIDFTIAVYKSKVTLEIHEQSSNFSQWINDKPFIYDEGFIVSSNNHPGLSKNLAYLRGRWPDHDNLEGEQDTDQPEDYAKTVTHAIAAAAKAFLGQTTNEINKISIPNVIEFVATSTSESVTVRIKSQSKEFNTWLRTNPQTYTHSDSPRITIDSNCGTTFFRNGDHIILNLRDTTVDYEETTTTFFTTNSKAVIEAIKSAANTFLTDCPKKKKKKKNKNYWDPDTLCGNATVSSHFAWNEVNNLQQFGLKYGDIITYTTTGDIYRVQGYNSDGDCINLQTHDGKDITYTGFMEKWQTEFLNVVLKNVYVRN